MDFRHIEVVPHTPTLGATIAGIDLDATRSQDVYDEIRAALWQHGVLFFHDQELSPESYLRLGEQFGQMEEHEFFPHVPGYPQIQSIAHEGHEAPETDRWHHDVSFRERPNLVSMLRMTDLPPNGGDTLWCSCAAAYEALAPQLQALLDGLEAEHDLPFHMRRANSPAKLLKREALAARRSGKSDVKDPDEMDPAERSAAVAAREAQLLAANPPVVHPAVISHPVTGRRMLYVNSIWTKRLLGMHMDLSDALLSMLFEWVKKPEFMVRFQWRRNSMAMWDNSQTQHYAVFDYAPHYRAGQRMTCGSFEPRLDPPR